ncbi:MAG TPA: 4Fe-4S dicluster domain-containing protein [Tepidisphaeraceae bacterium]|nr:4Fe-4S dicluster domain-containing protein [Tepidisphaeraceae bacterium]
MATAAFIPIGVDPDLSLPESSCAAALSREGLTVALLIQLLREAGIEINRMTSPDLSGQLHQAAARPADVVVCSGLDADSVARLNANVAVQFAREVQLGVECVAKVLKATQSIVVFDSALPSGWRAGRRRDDSMKLVQLDHAYPQLHPALLLPRVLSRQLVPGRQPLDAGVVMIDAAAAWTIARLLSGNVSSAVPVCVRDHRTGRVTFAAVAPEVMLADLMHALRLPTLEDGDCAISGELILHQPADLTRTAGRAAPVLHICRATAPTTPAPCTRCNWCADVCPTRVLPMVALEAVQMGDASLADRSRASLCIECGLCDYVCPSRLPLVKATRAAAGRARRGVM